MMEKESYFGRYWENVSAEKTVSIHGVKAHYQDFVKLSGLTDTLANFYHGIVPGTADIPTVCIFDDSIDPRARLKFLKVISNCGFRTVSYSTSFNSLTALYFNGDVFGRSELSDSTEGFGKKIVTISASGTSVNISALIYLDGSFVTCSDTMRIPTGGENPVKEALVRHIVDENNRANGFLTPEGVRREYLYQMQYAEEWLKLANETDDNSSFKVSYHLSIDPEISYSLNISKSFILRKQAELVKPVSDGLAKFCSGMNASDISAYLFMDMDRVGIYGCSAGGQESTTAVLLHPEFYKAAYSACGCHDNRMDKIWWNELWLGYPVGDQYKEGSNVENAHLLSRPLMLVVGELDDNVDPASTMQVVNALIKANKDFELVVIPGAHHTMGEDFGEHKRYDFFVRHLQGGIPPEWNAITYR